MKRYLLFLSFICFATFINAQTYQLIYDGQDISGKEISVEYSKLPPYGLDGQPKVPAFLLEVKNVSDANIAKTRVDFNESIIGEGVEVQACESVCFISKAFSLDQINSGASRTIKFQFNLEDDVFKETILKVKIHNLETPDQVQNITVKITSGNTNILAENLDNSLEIYPNPANDNFTISHNYGSDAQIAIFDMLGKKIETPIYNNGSYIKINSSSWDSGYYFCRLFKDGKIEKTIKIVISH